MSGIDHEREENPTRPAESRRTYRAPRLTMLGDVRSLTLGGTPGSGDSVNTATTQSPTG